MGIAPEFILTKTLVYQKYQKTCHNNETSKHIMLGPENVFLSTKANLATSQDATLLPTHFYDYDY
jgi:hypothetical protein